MGYDLAGRRLSLVNPDSGKSTWQYDETSGDLIVSSNDRLAAQNQQIRYEYDHHRLLRIIYPDKAPTEHTYDSAGRISKTTDASGSTALVYGKLGDITAKTIEVKSLQNPGTVRTYQLGYKTNYLGQAEEITYPDGERVQYTYDEGGQVTKITGTKANGQTVAYVKGITYDQWGQRLGIELGNATQTKYQYDLNRRWMNSTETQNSRGDLIQKIDYEFDPVGNVMNRNDSFSTGSIVQTYEYDDLYQLVGAAGEYTDRRVGGFGKKTQYTQTYSFDDIGNMTRKTSKMTSTSAQVEDLVYTYDLEYTYDPVRPHQALTIGQKRYHYDLAGNQIMEEGKATIATVKQRPIQTQDLGKNRGTGDEALGTVGVVVDSGKTSLNWDSENRLILYRNDTASGQYAYNPAGLRTNKSAQSAETFYPDESFQEYVRSGDRLQSKHILLGKERIATVIGYPGDYGYQVNHTYYYHSDHLGSASAITDPNGRVYERNVYMPYGEKFVEELTNQLDDIHYGFTGKEKDKESGLTYFGARFLDSRTSRWLSSDPALGEYMPTGDKDKDKNLPGLGGVFNQVNMNLYHYAGNNPIKFTDPDGRDTKVSWGGTWAYLSKDGEYYDLGV